MSEPDIELHIEELVLHGFAARERQRLGDALERGLAALFIERGVPELLRREGAVERLDVGEFRVSQNNNASAVGAELAQKIYEGLNR